MLKLFFAQFDKICIFGVTGSIYIQRNMIFLTHLCYRTNILYRHRLTTRRIVGNGHNDQPDVFRPIVQNNLFHFFNIHIALEWDSLCGIFCFLNDTINSTRAAKFYMSSCCIKEHIGDGNFAWTKHGAKKNFFTCASLMNWLNKTIIENIFACFNKFVITG
ncbi:hypothetical protein SDC9_161524 [bioreactor metagenome]|uniref:Uncharacterized protein n=1 Tax=bioreactor metagenome TaxID=1076179 RepID=A0A645FIH0_9ZZZZ